MLKTCARCEKTVYPLEELKCLDKAWHKTCFKCQECGMALSMKTYKGYNKLPYCEAHIPKPKATTVNETPEYKRIAENTKIQSNVQYHAEFEKAKGKFTQVADMPEIERLKQNSRIISNVEYHGEYARKAEMEQKRSLTGQNGQIPAHSGETEIRYNTGPSTSQYSPPPPQDPYHHGAPPPHMQHFTHPPPPQQQHVNSPYGARQSATSNVIYTSQQGPVPNQNRRVGSITDYDPMNERYGSISQSYPTHPQGYTQQQQQQQQQTSGYYHQQSQPTGRVYRAMYDYDAQDSDEISFRDGDIIVNCTPIDEGWMTGTVQRTGNLGMLPANYVEPVN